MKRLLFLTVFAVWLGDAAVVSAVPPANDDFANAQEVVLGENPGTAVGASAEPGEPRTHFPYPVVSSVWFTFTPSRTGLYTVRRSDGTVGVAVYTGERVNALFRVAAGSAFQGNAGVSYKIQVTDNAAFTLVVAEERPGTVVLPFFSAWEFAHPIRGEDPTAEPGWAANWKKPQYLWQLGVAKSYVAGLLPGPFGFSDYEGPPGIATDIGYPVGLGSANNAAYFRTSFTLLHDTSNLWAEVVADDGAYLYIDDFPGIPLHIAARLSEDSSQNGIAFGDFRPQPDVHATGAIPTTPVPGGPVGCRAYTEGGFNVEWQTQMVYVSGLVGKLSAGEHSVAVSVHQTVTGSADMAFDLQLLDFLPRKLGDNAMIGTAFDETPYVPASGPSAGVPVAEHQHAPRRGQSELAWYCVSPTARGATALPNGGAVVTDEIIGATHRKALRLKGAEAQRFMTEPIAVAGLPQFTAAVKIRTSDSGDGFEPDDGFRIFLETSSDGINFSEPTPPLELQPQINGPEALDLAAAGWVTRQLVVIPSDTQKAVRLVMSGGTDDTTESVYLDDVMLVSCALFPVVTNVEFHNQDDDDAANDTVSFDLGVESMGTSAATFTTDGLGPAVEREGPLNGDSIHVIAPVAVNPANGARQSVEFRVRETGNPQCFAAVSITVPACSLTGATLGAVTRSEGADAGVADDDTFRFTATATATHASAGWKLVSSDARNPAVYAVGDYGSIVEVVVPATVTPTLVFVDRADPFCKRSATLDLSDTRLAFGKTVLGGVLEMLYVDPPAPSSGSATWLQASVAAASDTEFTPDAATVVLSPQNTANANGATMRADGMLESAWIDVTGKDSVRFEATLRAFEATFGGFLNEEVFRMELDLRGPGGNTTVNLIEGYASDFDDSGTLNGYTGTASLPYDVTRGTDEFNASLALASGYSRGTFFFSYAIPENVTSIRVRFSGSLVHAAKWLFVKNLAVTDLAGRLDGDADGLPDGWELQFFGDQVLGPLDDPDGDGMSNLAEYRAGTAPTDSSSRLFFSAIVRGDSGIRLTWPSVPGRSYRLQKSTELNAATWLDTGSPIAAASAPANSTSVTVDPGSAPRAFYRVVVVP